MEIWASLMEIPKLLVGKGLNTCLHHYSVPIESEGHESKTFISKGLKTAFKCSDL